MFAQIGKGGLRVRFSAGSFSDSKPSTFRTARKMSHKGPSRNEDPQEFGHKNGSNCYLPGASTRPKRLADVHSTSFSLAVSDSGRRCPTALAGGGTAFYRRRSQAK